MPRPYCAAAPDSWRSWVTSTLVPRPDRASVAVTTMLAWPRPFSSAPARVAPHPLGGLVTLGDVRGPAELQPDRAHPDRDPALVLLAAEVLGQLRAGQAGGHLRDVLEELPDLLDRLGDLEVVLDQHRALLHVGRRDRARTPGGSRRSRSSRSRPRAPAGSWTAPPPRSSRRPGRLPRRSRRAARPGPPPARLPGVSARGRSGPPRRATRRPDAAAGPARPGWPRRSPGARSGPGPGRPAPAPGRAGRRARPGRRGTRAPPRPAWPTRPGPGRRAGPPRPARRVLVAVALGGHHHHRALVRVGRGERPRRPAGRSASPARGPGRPGVAPSASGPRRPGAARAAPARCRPPARPRSGRRWAPRSSRPAPPAAELARASPSSSSRGTPSVITCRASRITTGSAHAPPIQPCSSPSAVMIAREPCWPEDGPCRQTTVASANGWPAPGQLAGLLQHIETVHRPLPRSRARAQSVRRPAAHRRRRGAG